MLLLQSIISLLSSSPSLLYGLVLKETPSNVVQKSIAIIGAGSAGLAMLQVLQDIPFSVKEGWQYAVFEEREDVGGVWVPDNQEVHPPRIPETPLYPLLHTNTPVPFMTYPKFPFLEGTPLYPNHTFVRAYHARYAKHHNLSTHINLNHKIESASWVGNTKAGYWNLTVILPSGELTYLQFSHLVVASGNHHLPRIPTWKGQADWIANGPKGGPERRIVHSVYYRDPAAFTNLSVLVVGNGASGRDAASQLVGIARKVVISARHDNGRGTIEGVEFKPDISYFAQNGVVFVDGSKFTPDVVLLGTGYEQRKPFLERGGALRVDHLLSNRSSFGGKLTTNLKYYFPLYRHILSLSPEYPTNALSFIGLPMIIANCPSDWAQSLFAAYAILQPTILPSRSTLLKELQQQETIIRQSGLDPYTLGHQMVNVTAGNDYQDALVDFLKEKGALPRDGYKFVEQWRRDVTQYLYLQRGWKHLEALGLGDEWTRDIRTEEQWARLMFRVNEWQKQWEELHNIPFRLQLDLT